MQFGHFSVATPIATICWPQYTMLIVASPYANTDWHLID